MNFELYAYGIAVTEGLTMLVIGLLFVLDYRKRARLHIAMLKDAKNCMIEIKELSKLRHSAFEQQSEFTRNSLNNFYHRWVNKVDQQQLEFQFQALCSMLDQAKKLHEMYLILKK